MSEVGEPVNIIAKINGDQLCLRKTSQLTRSTI